MQYSGGTEKQKQALKRLYGRTAIKTRGTENDGSFFKTPTSNNDFGPTTGMRMQQFEKDIPQLAFKACMAASNDANANNDFDFASVHSLITVSCTGFYSPGFDIELIDTLKLNRAVARTHVGYMGCHGTMNALKIADAVCRATSQPGYALICAAELCSLHFQYAWNTQNLVANSLFADGAAALLLSTDNTQATQKNWEFKAAASYVVPDTIDAMSWKMGDNGFSMTLSSTVPDIISKNLKLWIENFLDKQRLKIEDIAGWAVHPGGTRILDAVQESLQLQDDALESSRDVLEQHGNMSSPTIIFVLEKIKAKIGVGPTVLLAFGPGLTIEAALLA